MVLCQADARYFRSALNWTKNPSIRRNVVPARLPRKMNAVLICRIVQSDSGASDTADSGITAAGWRPDPFGRHQLRYWDGTKWTAHVSNSGETSSDSPFPSPQPNAVAAAIAAPAVVAPAVVPPSTNPDAPKQSKGKWILIGGLAVVAIIVIAVVASTSGDSGESFKMRIADQAVFETADYGTLDQLGNETNAPSVCDNAAQSLQQASVIIASWSTPLKNAWNAAEGHFETAITACKAGDGQAMVRAYDRAESSLEGLRKLLGNLDCKLDPDDPGGEICK